MRVLVTPYVIYGLHHMPGLRLEADLVRPAIQWLLLAIHEAGG